MKVLPKHIDIKRLTRIALSEVRKNPKLLECTPISFVASVMIAAQLGLEPGQELGLSFLVPFFNSKTKSQECQFILGYKGMITLARNSGSLTSISSQCVYSNDIFEMEFGVNDKLRHVPNIGDRGELIGAYCVAKLKDGAYQFNFIEKSKLYQLKTEQLNKITNEYARKYSPWSTSEEEMFCKTTIRKLFKYLPISTELQKAIYYDEAAERVEQKETIELEFGADELGWDAETGEITNGAEKVNDELERLAVSE
jgi:recombination protein RecT